MYLSRLKVLCVVVAVHIILWAVDGADRVPLTHLGHSRVSDCFINNIQR